MGGCTSDNRIEEDNASSKSTMKLADIRSRQLEFDSQIGSGLVSKGFRDEISDLFASMHPFSVKITDQPHIEEADRIRNQFMLKFGGLERQSQFDTKFSQVLPHQEWHTNDKGSNLFWGSLVRGLPHGWGELYSSKGVTVLGYFEEGLPNYHAKIKYSNDSVYVGGVYRQMRDGFGCLTKRSGEMQEGHWRFNLLNGFASIKDPTGKVISSGEFINGRLASSPQMLERSQIRNIEASGIHRFTEEKSSQSGLNLSKRRHSGPNRSILKYASPQDQQEELYLAQPHQENANFAPMVAKIRFSEDLRY